MKELERTIRPESGILSIGEVSKQSQVKVVTIRYYESLKLFPDPRRRGSGRDRKYSQSYVERLIFIKKARKLGFSLKEIKEIIRWVEKKKQIPKKRLVKKVYQAMDSIDEQVRELRKLKKELYGLVVK